MPATKPRGRWIRAAVLLLAAALGGPAVGAAVAESAPPPASPPRTFDPQTGVLTSSADPPLRWRAPEGFRYLGRLEFPLEEKAWVDRHFFARVNGGEIERLIVFQFEGFRDGVEGRYRFGIPEGEDLAGSDYRFSPERIRFAGHGWVHNTWVFDQAASAAERLGYESDRTLAFLADQGLAIGDELMMSRFVTEIGPDGRDELILFYLMPLAEVGRTLPDFPGGGPPSDAYDRLSEQLTRESLTAFANETFGPPDG